MHTSTSRQKPPRQRLKSQPSHQIPNQLRSFTTKPIKKFKSASTSPKIQKHPSRPSSQFFSSLPPLLPSSQPSHNIDDINSNQNEPIEAVIISKSTISTPSDYQAAHDAVSIDQDQTSWLQNDHYDYGRTPSQPKSIQTTTDKSKKISKRSPEQSQHDNIEERLGMQYNEYILSNPRQNFDSQLTSSSSSSSSASASDYPLETTSESVHSSQYESASIEFYDPDEATIRYEYIHKPLYWNNYLADKISKSHLLGVTKLSDNILERARILPGSTTLPILLHHDQHPQTDERLARVKWTPSLKGRKLRQFQYLNTIIPHTYAEIYGEPTATQSFFSFPLGWFHSSFQSTSIPLSLSQNSLESLHKRQVVYWNNELRNTAPHNFLFNNLEEKQANLQQLPDDHLTDLEKYVKYDLQADWERKKYTRETSDGFNTYIKGEKIEYIEMWRKTTDLPKLKLSGDVKHLISNPWSSDMIRFDVDTQVKVISKYKMKTQSRINVFVPPAFHSMLLKHPLNHQGKLTEQFLVSTNDKHDQKSIEYDNKNKPFGKQTTTYFPPLTSFKQDYNQTDPFFHPTSIIYQFNLNWTHHKFYPFPLFTLHTAKSLLALVGVFGKTLQQIPAMDTPAYRALFDKFPVSYRMPVKFNTEATFFDSQDRFNEREAKRLEEQKQQSLGEMPAPNGLNQTLDFDQNIYHDFNPDEIIHMVAPLYPISQPAVDKELSRAQKMIFARRTGIVFGGFLLTDFLLDVFL